MQLYPSGSKKDNLHHQKTDENSNLRSLYFFLVIRLTSQTLVQNCSGLPTHLKNANKSSLYCLLLSSLTSAHLDPGMQLQEKFRASGDFNSLNFIEYFINDWGVTLGMIFRFHIFLPLSQNSKYFTAHPCMSRST